VIRLSTKHFAFVCPTDIAAFARRTKGCKDREARVIAGSTDNDPGQRTGRGDHKDVNTRAHGKCAVSTVPPTDSLGVRRPDGVAYRATFMFDPDKVIDPVSVANRDLGRNPAANPSSPPSPSP